MIEKKLSIAKTRGGFLHAVHFLSKLNSNSGKGERNPFVILCHGLSGDKYEWGRFLKTTQSLTEVNYNALIFDFSGSGENEREFITLSKQIEDLEDVYKWVQEQGYTRIAILGLSFGGLTALLANLLDVKTFVFWAPAFYLKEMFLASLEKSLKEKPLELPSSGNFGPIRIDYSFVKDLNKYNVNSHLQKIKTPSLIIQGTKDRNVRPKFSQEAFKQMPQDENHKYLEIENATHNFDGDYLNKFIQNSIDWIKKYI